MRGLLMRSLAIFPVRGTIDAYVFICILALWVTSCVTDADKCGNDMVVVSGSAMNQPDYCTPKVDTSPKTPTGNTSDTSSDMDGGLGKDGGVVEACAEPCADDEFCDLSLAPPDCVPVATGQGEPCETPEECASFGADFCETFISHSCLVQNCSPEYNNCSEGYICCDFASWGLPTLCVNAEASGGSCSGPPAFK